MAVNSSDVYSVDDWNRELSELLIPNNVILSLYILIGLTGNSLVLYIYKFKFKGKIGERYFVPYLAITDLMASIVCSSLAVAVNMMQASFVDTHLCKAWWFFAAFATFSSSLILLTIAVQRYLKVVKSDGTQMGTKLNRFALACALSISVLCAAPTPILYGSVPFPNDDGSLTGWRCSKIKGKYKIGSVVYGSFIGVVLISIVSSLIGLYIQIGRTIFVHMKYTKKVSKAKFEKSSSSTKTTSVDEISTDVKESTVDKKVVTCLLQSSKLYNTNDKMKTCSSEEKTVVDQHEKINKRILHKFTLMFMLITIIFLICFVPKVLLMLMEALNPRFWEEFNDTGRAAVLFVYRMYIINNISNPFVYAFMDTKFQTELKKLCSFF